MMISKQNGFTLVEILVAMVVLSIGLLGLAGLQSAALQSNFSANARTQATIYANNLIDRMRANPSDASETAYINANAVMSLAAPPNNQLCNAVTPCTPAQMAAADLDDFFTELSARLANPSAVICLDSTPEDGTPAAAACDGMGPDLVLKIWWDDDRQNDAQTRFTTPFRIN